MDLQTFKDNYKKDFYTTYVADSINYFKDGFFYYKAKELMEKYKEEIKNYSEGAMTLKSLTDEIKKLVFSNEDYFRENFENFNYEDRRNFIVYCWVKTRLKNNKKTIGIVDKPFPKKRRNSFKVVW